MFLSSTHSTGAQEHAGGAQREKKSSQIAEKNNSLCIWLDIDPDKFSSGVETSLSVMESFGKDVIDAANDFCPVYKPNFALVLKEF